ncbi:MAG: ABC transporter ATP-binding protein [Alphaproteobacteria bacterium]|jgi:branched-chain amino acid transport system ATP-binding protein|nr:ABC transporter ATP-binding protein [Alphaproteobacteria bacterium]
MLLEVDGLVSGYGKVAILDRVALTVAPGELVAIVGGNGAGKSTLLRTISGLLPVMAGTIRWEGRDVTRASPRTMLAFGLLHIAEGRRLFRQQSVQSNLDLAFYGAGLSREEERRRIDDAFARFPILHEKRGEPAGALSGGQQQILTVAQAWLRRPRLLMLDEPSLGLAPVIVDQVLDLVLRLRSEGCAIILVEQLVERAMEIADTAYVMQNGRIMGSGPAREMIGSELLQHAYLA